MIITRNLFVSWLALTATVAVGCANDTSPEENGTGLAVRIESLEAGSGRVEYSLVNHTAEPVHVLRWKTALDEMPDQLFEISRDGVAVEYRGPILRRVQPDSTDYVEVAPGQRLYTTVDLTQLYNVQTSGTYDVQLRTIEPSFMIGNESVAVESKASLRLDISAPAGAQERTVAARGSALARTGCTAAQYEELAAIEDEALENTREATQHFDELGYDERALRWFGTGNSEDAYYVRMGLQKIFDYLDQGNIEYVCNAGGWCANGKTAAWVDPITAPGRINLCTSFWQPDQAPWYTKVIAITHELAHFHTSWLDEGYREAALALAKNQPARARRNAENYALYTVDSEIPCVASIESCN